MWSLRICLGACMAAVVAAAPAAAQPSLSPPRLTAEPGERVQFVAHAATGDRCRLAIGRRRAALQAPAETFTIRARVSRRARPGTHRVRLRCGDGRAVARIRVLRRTHSRGQLLAGPVRIRAYTAPPPDGAPAPPPAEQASLSSLLLPAVEVLEPPDPEPVQRPPVAADPATQAWWDHNVDAVKRAFRNGQCTDWTELRRPDIVQAGYMRRFEREGPQAITMSWDAKDWTDNARAAGFTVGARPAAGSIMVVRPGSLGAGAPGHVAVVESVALDGSFVVSHMNAPTVGVVTQTAYSARDAADAGVTFIY